ncbi:MAG: ferrous iron transport protein A [Methanobrevibacter sp.]|jgi:ferrous iron transport protein A|nr:ferrous iron transport protein A [Candidatus Methanovirga basalitermitum]
MINREDSAVIKSLNELKTEEEGTIISYNNEEVELKRHLLGMGFVKGAKIKLEKIAPLGDPIKIKIKGYSMSLRKNEAKNIILRVN